MVSRCQSIPPLRLITLPSKARRIPPIPERKNSVRGKEYRAKRKRYEEELQQHVQRLREQVNKLQTTHTLSSECLQLHIPLIKTLREYFNLFSHGVYACPPIASTPGASATSDAIIKRTQHQKQFLHAIMDENAMVSGKYGPNASLDQWRLYTMSHTLLRVELQRIETTYSGDIPILTVYTDSSYRVSRKTIELMFPGALSDMVLMNKFLDREVACKGVFRYSFTEQGLIASESCEFGLVEGYLGAGCSLEDVAALMKFSVISPSYAIPSELLASNKKKSSITYLLST